MIRHKYNAVRTEVDEIKFSSKLEASYYKFLKLCEKSGQVLFFLRQIPFDLPGKTKYLADFMIFFSDGTVKIVDCKGVDTPMSILKRKQVEAIYPVKIEVVHKVAY